jgi:predicted DNA-binding transcriptional regulator AlpA
MSAAVIELPERVLDEIAERVAARLAERSPPTGEPWLNVEQAAAHLGLSTSQVYSLCSARRTNGFPVVKEGSRSYFRASELDRWRERGGRT